MPPYGFIRAAVPDYIIHSARRMKKEFKSWQKSRLPVLDQQRFLQILRKDLGVKLGQVVFIHASINELSATFNAKETLNLLLETVGPDGTLLFPTYPRELSYDFLKQGKVFNIKRSPSFMGLISEIARRNPNAFRSLHPIKSVCAIGAKASELVATHHLSPYPFDDVSPYAKIMEHDGVIIGLGVSTAKLSFSHCCEDYLKDRFPINPYHESLFESTCINSDGDAVQVPTYAHDGSKMGHNVPLYMRKYVDSTICRDIIIDKRPFFVAHSKPLFSIMIENALNGKTIYH